MTSAEEESSLKAKIVLEIDAFPFKGLKISDNWKHLETIKGRTLCSLCKKSRKYFCYTCYVPVSEIRHLVPKIKLPIKIDIVKHAKEMDGKSTAVHAAVIAPDDVQIFTYPCIPDYAPQENVVLIFPNTDAVSVEEVCRHFIRKESAAVCKKARWQDGVPVIHRAVFIDSTWNQSRGIFKDSRIKGLPSVVLKSRLSQFWRHQTDSPRWYLATVEAIHQFLVELDAAQWQLNCATPYDEDSKECQSALDTDDTESNPDNSNRLGDNALSKTSDSSENPDNKLDTVYSLDGDVVRDSESATTTCEISLVNSEVVLGRKVYSYNGKYDNLLFFFRFMYSMIHTLYDHDNLRSYKRRLE